MDVTVDEHVRDYPRGIPCMDNQDCTGYAVLIILWLSTDPEVAGVTTEARIL